MCLFKSSLYVLIFLLACAEISTDVEGSLMSMMDFRYWRCVMKREMKCPDSEVNFFLFTPERPYKQWVHVGHRDLRDYGWKLARKNVFIIHGFNGTHAKTPISFLRDAYLSRKDYNVFMVDWSMLSRFPCYMSALSNMRLAAQCTAQLYSLLTQAGALAKMTTCVGHSLGAHVCGMMSEHLTQKQYKIVGLDPARPLVSEFGSRRFRLTREDAHVVHVLHTNAGFLGESGPIGHADFCINGGQRQPGCKGHLMRISRCSHFMSSCYFAASVRRRLHIDAIPCDSTCPKQGRWGLRMDRKPVLLGNDIPDTARGMYCAQVDNEENCPFD
ncbi:PREDICTED: lipase member H-A-like [Papilio xuthus]|uniref:Lipase member H-A-like n=1 Tax=Papilio xuthus TaxID=66420 RepID=A0AAJ7EIQ7_PAPXU|nr:PREDICTED: lipase member H-A-like [Papilio xuthus]